VKGAAESVHVAKNAELESLVMSQTWKIAELEAACADLKGQKEGVMAGYQRLLEKHTALIEKMEQDWVELTEDHATELAMVQGELDQEMRNYTDYRLNVRRHLHHLHEIVASTFDEVRAQCLPFLAKSVKVEDFLDWVIKEVKTVPDTIWQLNDNFIVFTIERVLNMLNNEGCQELSRLHGLATSRDASVMQDVPDNM
jgi:hypothetical protein